MGHASKGFIKSPKMAVGVENCIPILYCQNETPCQILGQMELFNPVFKKYGILPTHSYN